MAEAAEQKNPERKLERVGLVKCPSYDAAVGVKQTLTPKHTKVKIVRRNDETYDVVTYNKVAKAEAKKQETAAEPATDKKHGLTAKERRRQEKRS